MDQWYNNVGVEREEVLHVNKAVFLKSSKTKKLFFIKKKQRNKQKNQNQTILELERWFSSYEHLLLLQRPRSGS